MRILVAKSAGFCFGVRRALALVGELTAKPGSGRVVTLGPLVHNQGVVADLRARGVEPISPAAPLEAGLVAVVRSHGLPVDEVARLREAGAEVHDGTCPYVRSAQTIARRMAGEGYAVLVFGEADHPEVLSILSHARAGARGSATGPAVLATDELGGIAAALEGERKVAVLAQTTQPRTRWRAAVDACLGAGAVEVRAFDTVCEETEQRREEAAGLASLADLTLVVGDRESANTLRLAELCATRCRRCHRVESAADLDPDWLLGAETVAVTAGASTPASSVAAIVERLRELAAGRAVVDDGNDWRSRAG